MPFDPDPPRKWTRKSFDESKFVGLTDREVFALETDRDLVKPIEQLVCDVQEETHTRPIPGESKAENYLRNMSVAQKRFASLMARVAVSNDKVARQMLWLTVAIFVLTALIAYCELMKK